MTRIATLAMQNTLSAAFARSQEALAESQLQLATGKVATDYAGLGVDAVRTLSARSLISQQTTYQNNTSRLSTTLSLYDANLTTLDDSLTDFRSEIYSAIGTGEYPSLQGLIENAFAELKSTLNATESGVPLFAGAQTSSDPFTPETLDDLIGLDVADAFNNDSVIQSSRVGDGVDLEYGQLASDIGANLTEAFKMLAEAGPFEDSKLTDTQIAALEDVLDQLDLGLTDLRSANATNGQNQNRLDDLATRAEERSTLLTELVGNVEDADLSQVALDLTQRQTTLEASYSVFAQLQDMSLVNYLS
ncbi:flagellin [Novosphingobium profundi]|uniref:flagellin n=1 Tax=Novosphingobium profundi TaxID=1774954 RepID=UPI001BDA0BE5|nr:flagellin [Novosphingobium profundi]MBT0670569.1 flagellin [Novosphingobium profundi]